MFVRAAFGADPAPFVGVVNLLERNYFWESVALIGQPTHDRIEVWICALQSLMDASPVSTGSIHKREVLIVPVDFFQGQTVYTNIAEQVQELDIGILVNNVGYFEYPSDFECLEADSLRKTIELNCQTVVQMTKLLLPGMVEKRKGIVVNISSLSGDFARNVYFASKCFVNNFSEGLRHYYTGKGIIVQTVAPCIVATRMSGFKDSQVGFFVVGAVHYARAAVATVGILNFPMAVCHMSYRVMC